MIWEEVSHSYRFVTHPRVCHKAMEYQLYNSGGGILALCFMLYALGV
jgi:hypothetical protein